MKKCTIEGCERPLKSRGRCQSHYVELRNEENRLAGNLCAFDGCDRPVLYSHDLCRSHYRQVTESGKELRSLQWRSKPVDGVNGQRLCRGCQEWKDRTAFSGNRTLCRRCTRLTGKYGLTATEFDALLAKQGGRCAICGTTDPGGNTGMWHVDHDHRCCDRKNGGSCSRCTAGLLCNRCNMGLGYFKDDPVRLARAAAYLKRVRALPE